MNKKSLGIVLSILIFVILIGVFLYEYSFISKNVVKQFPVNSPTERTSSNIPFFKGVNLVTYASDAGAPLQTATFNVNDSKKSLDQLYNDNARYEEIVLRGTVDSSDYTNIKDDPNNLSMDSLKSLISLSKSSGITPILKPHLFVDGQADSRQVIGESWGVKDSEIEQKWFNAYYEYIEKYAKLSQAEELPFLVIATELPSLVLDDSSTNGRRSKEWGDLISRVREIYKGKITYASNSSTAAKITWWGDLDYIGVDAYYTLSKKDNPSYNEIQVGWTHNTIKSMINEFPDAQGSSYVNIVDELSKLSNKYNKKIVFTEVGYRSADQSISHINDGKIKWGQQPLNSALQENAIKVLFEEFYNKPFFSGMFLWSWYNGSPNTSSAIFQHTHIIQNKPAENIMKQYYATNP